jgi:ferredoxin--NADP+ reductase
MHIGFYAAPKEILGSERVEGLRLERTQLVDGRAVGTGEFFDVAASAVVTAIGYQTIAPDGVPMEDWGTVANEDGRVAPGLYVVGWAKRGPSGTIPTNGPDSRAVADLITAEIAPGGGPGGGAIDTLLSDRNVRVIDFANWKVIAAAEVARAPEGHPQEKFTRIEEMLAVLDG